MTKEDMYKKLHEKDIEALKDLALYLEHIGREVYSVSQSIKEILESKE